MGRLAKDPPASEITPEGLYMSRREFMRNAVLFTATSAGVGGSLLWLMRGGRAEPRLSERARGTDASEQQLTIARYGSYTTDELLTPYRDITSYHNFYEFGTDKSDPAEQAHTLRLRPWTLRIEGEVHRPQIVDMDQLLGWFPLEERIYRMRCVEASRW